MNFSRGTIRSSPYVGVFCTITEEIALVPSFILPKEQKMMENDLEVNVIRANIANSPLIGIFAKGLKRKLAVTNLIEADEKKALEKHGLEIMEVNGFTSTGNLIALNENAGIMSPLLEEKETEKLKKFFGIKFEQTKVAGSDICGAAMTLTNKGFICHPNISEKELKKLETLFKVRGRPTTANYGDLFVGNSVIANTRGVIAGANTSGIELARIDEGLGGE